MLRLIGICLVVIGCSSSQNPIKPDGEAPKSTQIGNISDHRELFARYFLVGEWKRPFATSRAPLIVFNAEGTFSIDSAWGTWDVFLAEDEIKIDMLLQQGSVEFDLSSSSEADFAEGESFTATVYHSKDSITLSYDKYGKRQVYLRYPF